MRTLPQAVLPVRHCGYSTKFLTGIRTDTSKQKWTSDSDLVAKTPAKPATPSPAKPSPAQPSPVKPSQAKPSQARPSPAKPRQAKASPAQPSPGKPSPSKPSQASQPYFFHWQRGCTTKKSSLGGSTRVAAIGARAASYRRSASMCLLRQNGEPVQISGLTCPRQQVWLH
ncbi:transmembrane protease serine 13-like isoform X1 [Dermacentor albipictus]|uniref:transmembrane protease serine 13-like isoform X1 n=1 Tax=Dermacentor albipictus TaxID=60249 RepID=UPI0038FD172E